MTHTEFIPKNNCQHGCKTYWMICEKQFEEWNRTEKPMVSREQINNWFTRPVHRREDSGNYHIDSQREGCKRCNEAKDNLLALLSSEEKKPVWCIHNSVSVDGSWDFRPTEDASPMTHMWDYCPIDGTPRPPVD